MLFDGDLLLDMEMTIYEDLMVKCGGFSVTLSGSHFQFRTPFTSVCISISIRSITFYYFEYVSLINIYIKLFLVNKNKCFYIGTRNNFQKIKNCQNIKIIK